MGGAIVGNSKPGDGYIPLDGTPACSFCKESKYIKADIINMSTVKAVFECLACGFFRIAKPEEHAIWSRLKGRVAPPVPQSCATVIDHELVARSTNVHFQ